MRRSISEFVTDPFKNNSLHYLLMWHHTTSTQGSIIVNFLQFHVKELVLKKLEELQIHSNVKMILRYNFYIYRLCINSRNSLKVPLSSQSLRPACRRNAHINIFIAKRRWICDVWACRWRFLQHHIKHTELPQRAASRRREEESETFIKEKKNP